MRPRFAAVSLATSALAFGLVAAFVACTTAADSGGDMDASTPDGSGVTDSATDTSTGDASSNHPSDAGADGDASTACDPATAWPAMLAAAITPLHSAANLDLNHDGTGLVSLAYAETVNCALTMDQDSGEPGQNAGYWGTNDDVLVYTERSTSEIASLVLSGAYTGEVSFSSRANGAFGDHTYSIGIGKLNRDGAAWVIDWTNASAAVNEIFDAVNATFVPAFPVTSNCNSDNACWWGSSAPGGDSDAADISYFFVVNTVPIAVGINSQSEGGLVGWIELDFPNAIPSGGDGGSDANSGD